MKINIFGLEIWVGKTEEQWKYEAWKRKEDEEAEAFRCGIGMVFNCDVMMYPMECHKELEKDKTCHTFMGKKICYWNHKKREAKSGKWGTAVPNNK